MAPETLTTAKRHRVEPAGPEHVGAIATMYQELEWPARARDQAETMRFGEAAFAALHDPAHQLWVALVGKKVVGFAWARLWLSPFSAHPQVAHVEQLFVRREWRAFPEIGDDLELELRAWAHERQVPIGIEVAPDDRETWQRRGYLAQCVVMVREA